MEMTIVEIIVGVNTIILALLGYFSNKYAKRAQDAQAELLEAQRRAEIRAQLRAEEGGIVVDLVAAGIDLSILNAKALANLDINGGLEKALKAADKAKEAHTEFMKKVATQMRT